MPKRKNAGQKKNSVQTKGPLMMPPHQNSNGTESKGLFTLVCFHFKLHKFCYGSTWHPHYKQS